jgi:hypothetical protein
MRLTGLGRFALLVAGLLTVPACVDVVLAKRESETVDRTVPFPADGTLRLRNFSGYVHITATSGHEVVIKAVRTAPRDRLDHIALAIETSGSTVSIDANKRDSSWIDRFRDNVVDTKFDIEVPASARLDVHSFSSDLDVRDVTGTEKLETFSGTIVVTGVKAALSAKTFSGGVEIDATASGASPDLNVETFSGRIRARLADNAKGQVSFSSFSGSFDSDIPLTLHSMKRHKVSADLPGGGGSDLRFHTFSGSVRVTKS